MGMPFVSITSAPKITFVPNSFSSVPSIKARNLPSPTVSGGGLLIECSSRPQKKGTKHHMKTRPRKTQPWDVRRKPTVYAPLPPLPPDWTFASSDGGNDGGEVAEAALEAPASTG
ncbi:hypothetical protein HRI_002774800 [Hibiscus trionum]|uniref:50S ribosomal protein 6, chloroplastic n=1 Tax=Hibiscus trionum TaxID=183268 RepID=A0A9W7MA72_HIBTR|nr:hypothetical protein HRI_002774800 [Hibiscus trionum]